MTNVIAYLRETLPANGGKVISGQRLWLVVEGFRPNEEATARQLAAQAGVGAVIVARAGIDQTYEPRMLRTK